MIFQLPLPAGKIVISRDFDCTFSYARDVELTPHKLFKILYICKIPPSYLVMFSWTSMIFVLRVQPRYLLYNFVSVPTPEKRRHNVVIKNTTNYVCSCYSYIIINNITVHKRKPRNTQVPCPHFSVKISTNQ